MSEELTLDQVMARRFQLVEEAAVIAGRHKAELAPLNEELGMCEAYIKDHMLKSGLQQVKTDAGMTYFTSKDSVTVADMDKTIHFMLSAAPVPAGVPPDVYKAVVDHLYAHGMWGLLNKAVNKTAAKELLDAGRSPEELGVTFSSYKDLAWRRGK